MTFYRRGGEVRITLSIDMRVWRSYQVTELDPLPIHLIEDIGEVMTPRWFTVVNKDGEEIVLLMLFKFVIRSVLGFSVRQDFSLTTSGS